MFIQTAERTLASTKMSALTVEALKLPPTARYSMTDIGRLENSLAKLIPSLEVWSKSVLISSAGLWNHCMSVVASNSIVPQALDISMFNLKPYNMTVTCDANSRIISKYHFTIAVQVKTRPFITSAAKH